MSEPTIFALCTQRVLFDFMDNYYDSTEGDTMVVPEDLYFAAWFAAKGNSAMKAIEDERIGFTGNFYWKDKKVVYEGHFDQGA